MSSTLAELAINTPASIDLFEKYELNYYQEGEQTLEEACRAKGLDYSKIVAELIVLKNTPGPKVPLEEQSIEDLIDYINIEFHSVEKGIYREMELHIKKLIGIKAYPLLILDTLFKLEKQFAYLKEKLVTHCDKEEDVFIPYLKKLLQVSKGKLNKADLERVLQENPVPTLECEHEEATAIFSDVKKMVHGFRISENLPALYGNLMDELNEFEKNLHLHLHVENNILFPKCKALEMELKGRLN